MKNRNKFNKNPGKILSTQKNTTNPIMQKHFIPQFQNKQCMLIENKPISTYWRNKLKQTPEAQNLFSNNK